MPATLHMRQLGGGFQLLNGVAFYPSVWIFDDDLIAHIGDTFFCGLLGVFQAAFGDAQAAGEMLVVAAFRCENG